MNKVVQAVGIFGGVFIGVVGVNMAVNSFRGNQGNQLFRHNQQPPQKNADPLDQAINNFVNSDQSTQNRNSNNLNH